MRIGYGEERGGKDVGLVGGRLDQEVVRLTTEASCDWGSAMCVCV